MVQLSFLICLFSLLLIGGYRAAVVEKTSQQFDQIQSPSLEILLNPSNINAFKSLFQLNSEKLTDRRKTHFLKKRNVSRKNIVDVRTYEIARPVLHEFFSSRNQSTLERNKRGADTINFVPKNPKPQALGSSVASRKFSSRGPEARAPYEEAVRGPIYSKHSVQEFDVVDIDDPDDPRRRRNDSLDKEDDTLRDKRTFSDVGGEKETTTVVPFWKRKKENPPFVTGRGGSIPSGSSYIPAQHRSGENTRESHSLKSLDKNVQSNEITRSNQDNFYAATNRKTFGRQTDNVSFSTPKSVYDSLIYKGGKKLKGEEIRNEVGRDREEKKETLRDGRVTHEQYYNRQYYNHPPVYERPFYHPSYPYPTEVLSRGVEYYHRTYDPSSGRIIYYATLPDQGRSYDSHFFEPVNRNFYLNYRPYFYDPHQRNYVPPYDYRLPSGFVRTDFTRSGRSSSQAYSYPFPEKGKYSRNTMFNGLSDQKAGDSRNKTYVIYDAEDRPANSIGTPNINGLGYFSTGKGASQPTNTNFPMSFSTNYFPPPSFSLRSQFHPSFANWGSNGRFGSGLADSEAMQRPFHSPDVQLPLPLSHRSPQTSEDLQQTKKS